MTSEPARRLHPAAIAADALRTTLQLVGGLLIVAIVQGGSPGLAAAMAVAGIGVSSVVGWIEWRARTYWLDEVALHYRSGVFTPDQKVVPRARVQGVDTVTGLVQRLFGVVQLRVQVPGASSADEIVLSAVTYAEAARLREALGQPAPAQPDVHVRLGGRRLLLTALTSPQLSVALSFIAAFYALFDNVIDVERDGEGLLSRLDSAGAVATAAAVLLGAAYVLSFVAAVVVFAGFEVERDAQVLRIRRGLLERRAQSIPLERVDGVVIVEGLARGPLGLAALRLETASHGDERAVSRTLLPLVRRAEAEGVIARLVPGAASSGRAWRQASCSGSGRSCCGQLRRGRRSRCSHCSAGCWGCATTVAPACAWRTRSWWCARSASPAGPCSRGATGCRRTRSGTRRCRRAHRLRTCG
jgi:putative membrane protein